MLSRLLSACAALSPPRTTVRERLDALPRQGLPLERPVTIRWNAQLVPFIEAETDRDLAFALGLVHAHLRHGQLELYRHAVFGRLSELAGPIASDADQALRILDLPRAAPAVLAAMSHEDRAWLDAYVEGVNWQIARAPRLPPDFSLLGLSREAFAAEDIIGIGRLAGADVNWMALPEVLRARNRPDFARTWARSLASGRGGTSFGAGEPGPAETLLSASRSGSNCVAVSASRSATGGALLASDPHLGITVPNFWVLVGLLSPSYWAVGFTIPGVPVVTVGRSERLAWGGTNMRAAASDLIDITEREDAAVVSRPVRIRTRLWRDARRTIRDSRFGPVVSDIPFLGTRTGECLALRWTGHDPSDEIGAFLRVMRARNVDEFRSAFAGFAVSPQNMLAADADGNVIHVLAARLPRRTWQVPLGPTIDADAADAGWASFAATTDLPFARNPPDGFFASANNRPTVSSDVPIGWFFSADERVRRLQALLSSREKVGPQGLMALQRDAISTGARDLARELVRRIDETPGAAAAGSGALAALRGWDGSYDAQARAPVPFETLLHDLLPAVYGVKDVAALPPEVKSWGVLVAVLPGDLDALVPDVRAQALRRSLGAAERNLSRFPTWGDMHRLEMNGILSRAPLIGGAFRYRSLPASGSRDTVQKTAHGFVDGRHGSFYGSQARQVSDLSDPDANWFVLLGGQDGWSGSEAYLDQVDLWAKGEYVRLPLRPETVAVEFPLLTRLWPSGEEERGGTP